MRVLPDGAPVPPPPELEAANVDASSRFVLEPRPPSPANVFAADLTRDYARPWLALAAAFDAAGDASRAAADRERARPFLIAP